MQLWRPVGLEELVLILRSRLTQFPPRLPEQPIFYPVLNRDYAVQIARDWNAKSPSAAGYVASFEVHDRVTDRYERRVVGGREHEELWIPAEELDELNSCILSGIRIEAAFLGRGFAGAIAGNTGLKGRDATEQLRALDSLFDDYPMDFWFEIKANRDAVYPNFPFWRVCETTRIGVSDERREQLCSAIMDAWGDGEGFGPLISEATWAV